MNKKVPNKKVLNAKKKTPNTQKNSQPSRQSPKRNIIQTLLIIIITSIIVSFISSYINKMNKTTKTAESENTLSQESSNQDKSTNSNSESNISDTNSKETKNTQVTSENTESIPKEKEETQTSTSKNQTTITLYFIKISEDGDPLIVEKTRKIKKTKAILTKSINTLLQGPNSSESSEGLVSYIPSNSTLKKASIKSGVAFLDFNDNFQFNEYGNAGIIAQLYQIVYTATHLPNVSSVQITIDGKRITFLGGEGTIEIDKPLTKAYLDNF